MLEGSLDSAVEVGRVRTVMLNVLAGAARRAERMLLPRRPVAWL